MDSLGAEPASTFNSNFPQTPEQFDDDPRVSFSKLDQKWILETEDGAEYEYDAALKRWIPSVCAPFHSPGRSSASCQGADENGNSGACKLRGRF